MEGLQSSEPLFRIARGLNFESLEIPGNPFDPACRNAGKPGVLRVGN
jgi:hypothetical protein